MAKVRTPVKFAGFVIVALAVIFGIKAASSKVHIGGKTLAEVAKGSGGAGKAVDELQGVKALNLCVNTWGGYAGGEYFNGGFQANTKSRYWTEYHLPVNFIKIDDASSIDAWKSDKCQVHYGTVGNFTTEVQSLSADQPQIFFQPDWSYGGDVMIATNKVRTFQDLKASGPLGRKGKVALWVGSPSHELLNKTLDAAGMTQDEIEVVSTKDAFDAKKVFQAGQADVAVLWSPDDQDLLQSVPGSHVLASTKQCANCIADVFFAKKSYIESHQQELVALVTGWFKGAAEINTDPAAKDSAVKVLTVGLEQPEDFVKIAINNAKLTTYGDNVNFFNLKGGFNGVTGKSVYDWQGDKFRKIGLVDGSLPDWSQVVNTSILRAVALNDPSQAPAQQQAFTPATPAERSAEAFATKPITIEFPTGSATLTADAQVAIDQQIGNTVKSFTGARIRVEGNTDNVGSDNVNVPLSQRRAQAVVNYVVRKYGYDPNRFIAIGNGSDKPVADNTTAEGRQRNRRTDIGVISQ